MRDDDGRLDPEQNPFLLADELDAEELKEDGPADDRALGRADQVEELAKGLLAEGVDGRIEDGIRIMKGADGRIRVNGLDPGDVDDELLERLLEIKVPDPE